MKKMNMLFSVMMFALPMVVSNLAQAERNSGMVGTGWALPPGFTVMPPANPGYPAEYGPGFGGPFYRHDPAPITCESSMRQPGHCDATGHIRSAQLIRLLPSSKPCIPGRTWGWNGKTIWVSEGCKATFRVELGGRRF